MRWETIIPSNAKNSQRPNHFFMNCRGESLRSTQITSGWWMKCKSCRGRNSIGKLKWSIFERNFRSTMKCLKGDQRRRRRRSQSKRREKKRRCKPLTTFKVWSKNVEKMTDILYFILNIFHLHSSLGLSIYITIHCDVRIYLPILLQSDYLHFE